MTNNKSLDMTSGKAVPLVMKLSFPLMVGNLFQQLYSLIDAAIVGKLVSIPALAAIGSTSWVQWLILGICRDFGNTFSIIASKRVGAKNDDEFRLTFANSLMSGFVVMLLLMLISLLFIDQILQALHVPFDVLKDAKTYLIIFISMTPFIILFNIFAAMLQAYGQSSAQSVIMVISNIINIILDLIFVLLFSWGVTGVGFATLISQIIAVILLYTRIKKHKKIKINKEDRRWSKAIMHEFRVLCVPMFWNTFIIATGGLIVQTQVNKQGSAFAAGISASNKLFSLVEAIIMSIQTGTTIYIGQNLGARLFKRIKKGVTKIVISTECLTLILAVLVFIFSPYLLPLMLNSESPDIFQEAFETGLQAIRILSGGMLIMAPMYLYRGAIHTLGYAIFPLLAGVAQLIMRTFTVFALPPYLGKTAYYLPTIFAWAASLPIVYFSYRIYLKKIALGQVKTL